MERWFSERGDLRTDMATANEIARFLERHGVKSVVASEGILGCPHEEGIDYPDGEKCPKCPFWANRDRWTGELLDDEAE